MQLYIIHNSLTQKNINEGKKALLKIKNFRLQFVLNNLNFPYAEREGGEGERERNRSYK